MDDHELTTSERAALAAWDPVPTPPGFADRVVAARRVATHAAPGRPGWKLAAVLAGAVAAAVVTLAIVARTGPDDGDPAAPATGASPPAVVVARPAPTPAPVPVPAAAPPGGLTIAGGDDAVIYDPDGAATVTIGLPATCAGTGTVVATAGGRRREANGIGAVALGLDAGTWRYLATCGGGGASVGGTIALRRAAGTAPLPQDPQHFEVTADQRAWRLNVLAPSAVVRVKPPGPPSGQALEVVVSGADGAATRTEPVIDGVATVGGLRPGSYQLALRPRGGGAGPITALTITERVDDVPAMLASPPHGATWSDTVEVRGATRPGTSVAVDGVSVAVDGDGGFATTVPTPMDGVLVVRLDRPGRPAQFLVRRGSATRPR